MKGAENSFAAVEELSEEELERLHKDLLARAEAAQDLAAKRGVTSGLITLSHTEHHAMACVVLEEK